MTYHRCKHMTCIVMDRTLSHLLFVWKCLDDVVLNKFLIIFSSTVCVSLAHIRPVCRCPGDLGGMALRLASAIGAKWHRLLLFIAVSILVLLVYFVTPNTNRPVYSRRSYNAKMPDWRRILQSQVSRWDGPVCRC